MSFKIGVGWTSGTVAGKMGVGMGRFWGCTAVQAISADTPQMVTQINRNCCIKALIIKVDTVPGKG
jgi:hypothetical protein